jgi:hypothetical protein
MERLVQLLDDLDDLVSMLRLLSEPIRSAILKFFTTTFLLAIQVGGILLALSHPPLALAVALLLFVGLLYHSVTGLHLPLEIAS